MTNPTQHEKTLTTAKAMYREIYIFEEVYTYGKILKVSTTNKNQIFNPYKSAEHSQAVQEFLTANGYEIQLSGNKTSYCFTVMRTKPLLLKECSRLDLKTAIADCAYEVVKEKWYE